MYSASSRDGVTVGVAVEGDVDLNKALDRLVKQIARDRQGVPAARRQAEKCGLCLKSSA